MSNIRILRKIRKEFDYDEYINTNYDIVKPTNRGELRICCPNCDDVKYKCYVNNDKKLFNCYKCDFHTGNYDVFDFVAITESIPRGSAILKLAREFAPVTPLSFEEIIERAKGTYVEVEEEDIPHTIKEITALPANVVPLLSRTTQSAPFMDYLRDRGFSEQEMVACKIHYSWKQHQLLRNSAGSVIGDIGHRVFFPVYGPNGILVSWLARTIDNREPKYINCPDSEINKTLWPFVPPHIGSVILVEGIIDCLAVRRLGAPYSAYCTFGKKISQDQINHLKNWGVTDVTLFWDPEARKEIIRQVKDLKMQFQHVYVGDFSDWPPDIDAGDTLRLSDGVVHIERAVCNPIDVNSAGYTIWQLSG